MKKILLTFAITASIIASYSQVVDPKKIKPIEKLDVEPDGTGSNLNDLVAFVKRIP